MPTDRRAPVRRPARPGSGGGAARGPAARGSSSSRSPRREGPAARADRRRAVRRRGLVVLVVILLVAVGWLVTFSSAFDVSGVEVTGASSETEPLVRASVQVPQEASLLWLDTGEVAERVLALPRVATVDVRRSLPGTVVVAVTERTPVAGFPAPGGTALVDGTGLAYRTIAVRPAGVPLLSLAPIPGAASGPSPDDPRTVAAVQVLASLPPALRSRISEVRAPSPYDVAFTLADGPVVRWGDDDRNDTKAAVLTALLTRPGRVYDVSTPELAVVS